MNESKITDILRHVTVTVKYMPFVFIVAQIIVMLCFLWVDDIETTLLDLAFYVSPLVILFEFILSYLLRLCIWHRLQSSLPLLPVSSVVVDEYIYPLSEIAVDLNFAFVLFLSLSSLVNGYMLFCKRK